MRFLERGREKPDAHPHQNSPSEKLEPEFCLLQRVGNDAHAEPGHKAVEGVDHRRAQDREKAPSRPSIIVRWMQIMPTGPSGAHSTNPTASPFNKKAFSIRPSRQARFRSDRMRRRIVSSRYRMTITPGLGWS